MSSKSTLALAGATFVALLLAISCSDTSTSPSSPSAQPQAPTVSDPEVLVGGVSMSGLVRVGADEPSIFHVRVHAPTGLASIRQVTLQYLQPGPNHHAGGMMMGAFSGTVLCYDDGTHGDDVAGDGIYSFMDPDDDIACGMFQAPAGTYQYSFWCEDVYGQRSNTVSVTIDRG
jgi:hypothetical protein